MNAASTIIMLDTLKGIAGHAREVNANSSLRRTLALAQVEDKVLIRSKALCPVQYIHPSQNRPSFMSLGTLIGLISVLGKS